MLPSSMEENVTFCVIVFNLYIIQDKFSVFINKKNKVSVNIQEINEYILYI